MFNSLTNTFVLNNNVEIPIVGFGTFETPNDTLGRDAVSAALQSGYRHIDTASGYFNESIVGQAIHNSGLNRKDIFVTTKLWNADQGYDSTLRAFDQSMSALQLDYLDLYLIHWPVSAGHKIDWQETDYQTWRAFEKLYRDGRIRAIGVSNFLVRHLVPLFDRAEILPMVNQIEFHPVCPQWEVVQFCRQHKILVEAWGPMQRGKAFSNPVLIELGQKYGKNPGQICLRWSLQNGVCPLPKSVNPDRIRTNAELFDFELTDEDMGVVNTQNCEDVYTWDPRTSAF